MASEGPAYRDVVVDIHHPALLQGLEEWLHLGLISHQEVRLFCRRHLSSPLPEQAIAPDSDTPAQSQSVPSRDFANAIEPVAAPPATVPRRAAPRPTSPRPASSTSRWGQSLQSFMAEISVVWLLVLGVFLVVVSSGVLAASQWQYVSPAVQYGILFSYTLAFWGASRWTQRQPRLQLTAQMLQTTTLLIVPVNFWMMDGLRLWRSAGGWVVGVMAAVALSAITVKLLGAGSRAAGSKTAIIACSLGLSWLHWGWGWSPFPLLAIYLGSVGTTLALLCQPPPPRSIAAADRPASNQTAASRPFALPSLDRVTLAFALVLLVGRAILLAQVPLSQMGLALGLCGWLLIWLARPRPPVLGWAGVGIGLLLLGWGVSVTVEPPWQAIAISGLALSLVIDRIRRHWHVADVSTLAVVGLQTYWLLWRLLPAAARQSIVDVCLQLAGPTWMPVALLGLGLFPYVLLLLGFGHWLRTKDQPRLGQHIDYLALALGLMLTLVSLPNPLVRSLNLLASAVVLVVLTLRRPGGAVALVYLAHCTLLAAVLAGIDVAWPKLGAIAWGAVLLGGVTIELLTSLGSFSSPWRRSAWHLGLGLGGISYGLLLSTWLSLGNWGLAWLVVPTLLTGLAQSPRFARQPLAAGISTAGLVLLQVLTLGSAWPRLLALVAATLLMLLNTRQLRQALAASLTVGFGLGAVAAMTWKVSQGNIPLGWGVNLLAIATLALWLLWSGLRHQTGLLPRLYAAAANGWAIATSSLTLLLLILHSIFIPLPGLWPATSGWPLPVAAVLTTGAIAYRLWQHPQEWAYWSLAWGIDALLLTLLLPIPGPALPLAVAHLGLGLTAQLGGDVWVRHAGRSYRPSWHGIPLAYSLVGVMLGHIQFTPYTGLYTLATALVIIGVGRRLPRLAPFTFLGLGLVSLSAYELLIYQLMQAQGGSQGDGLVLLAGLGAAIALLYRLLSPWLVSYLRLQPVAWRWVAHLHWAGGSSMGLLALNASPSPMGERLWIALAIALALYSWWMGNRYWTVPTDGSSQPDSAWTYAAILVTVAASTQALYLLWPNTDLLLTWGAAIACLLALPLRHLPWQIWGWPALPGQQAAALLPGLAILVTTTQIGILSLLITAAFYAWLATTSGQIRLSYLSVALADWAILRILYSQGWDQPIWIGTLISATLLYVAQADPYLRSPNEREKRHLLRTLATGLLGLTAIYQAETSLLMALFTLALGLGGIAAGLALRTRAFLYVGTATFVIEVLRQVWIFISTDALILWAIGIVLGLGLIWIAATFEARRSQVGTFVQYWLGELDEWQ